MLDADLREQLRYHANGGTDPSGLAEAATAALAELDAHRSVPDLTTWPSGVFVADTVAAWTLDVFVPGESVTKGSTKAFAMKANNRRGMRAVVTATNDDKQKPWASAIHGVVTAAWRGEDERALAPVTDAVFVALDFVLPRRKGAPKTFTPWHTRKPDEDKLIRMVRDVLTGIVYADDAQVVASANSKREAEIDEAPGVRIRVAVLPDRRRT